jgi:hypothetical protein
MGLNPEVLEKIRRHLQKVPGEFRWSPIATIMKVDVLDFYEHLKWLRENEFTRNDKARVYWADRPIDEFRLLIPEMPAPAPKTPRIPKAKVSKTPKAKVPKVPKVPKVRSIVKEPRNNPGKNYRFMREDCLRRLQSLFFVNLTLLEIDQKIPGFTPRILRESITKSGGTVAWCRRREQAVYCKLKSTKAQPKLNHERINQDCA